MNSGRIRNVENVCDGTDCAIHIKVTYILCFCCSKWAARGREREGRLHFIIMILVIEFRAYCYMMYVCICVRPSMPTHTHPTFPHIVRRKKFIFLFVGYAFCTLSHSVTFNYIYRVNNDMKYKIETWVAAIAFQATDVYVSLFSLSLCVLFWKRMLLLHSNLPRSTDAMDGRVVSNINSKRMITHFSWIVNEKKNPNGSKYKFCRAIVR